MHYQQKSCMRSLLCIYSLRMGRKVTIDVTESGRKGGMARAANLSAKELSAGASTAASARWEQYYRDNPEKLKARQEKEARKTGRVGRPPKKRTAK